MCWGYILVLFAFVIFNIAESSSFWEEWWAYDGISGPSHWGIRNKEWALCASGKYQSPIDIDPQRLIFDPNLTSLRFDGARVDGELTNTRHDVTLEISEDPNKPLFVFTGGPYSYNYRATKITLHFGTDDGQGSEHTVAGRQFPLELQIVGYNADLYKNFTHALRSTHGLAVISILGVIDHTINLEFDRIVSLGKFIKYTGFRKEIHNFSILDIIPPSDYFITYEGSTTHPSCEETVTWIIINKPIHVTKDQMTSLRELNRWNSKNTTHLYPLEKNNFRPTQPLYRRPVRTNISPYKENEECAVKLNKSYKVNERLIGS